MISREIQETDMKQCETGQTMIESYSSFLRVVNFGKMEDNFSANLSPYLRLRKLRENEKEAKKKSGQKKP